MTQRERLVRKITQLVEATGDDDFRTLGAMLNDWSDPMWDELQQIYRNRRRYVLEATRQASELLKGR